MATPHNPTLLLHDVPANVLQDDFSPGKGNALQACVAALFHRSIESVPNFVTLDCGYEQGIQDFLGSSSSYSVTKIHCSDDGGRTITCQQDENNKDNLCILRGKSPRGDFGHVVVARVVMASSDAFGSFEMVHDPHPDKTFLDTKTKDCYGWFMIFSKKE